MIPEPSKKVTWTVLVLTSVIGLVVVPLLVLLLAVVVWVSHTAGLGLLH